MAASQSKESSINAFEAKTKFSSLLRGVQAGETYLITLRGEPVARLLPVLKHTSYVEFLETLSRAKDLRNKIKGSVPILEYKEEGREV